MPSRARRDIFSHKQKWYCSLKLTVILYSPSHLRSKYHSAKSWISLRSNITRRKANITEKAIAKSNCFFVVEEGGFEPPKSTTTDLQSAPFGHSGTLPYSLRWDWKKLELVDGFEPPTCWLQISCSTSWATPASQRSTNISQIGRWVKSKIKKSQKSLSIPASEQLR